MSSHAEPMSRICPGCQTLDRSNHAKDCPVAPMRGAPTWATTPPSAKADAALRAAAAGVLDRVQILGQWCEIRAEYNRCGEVNPCPYPVASVDEWLRNWNRDDLARVFAAAAQSDYSKQFLADSSINLIWLLALDDPRAALCALLDLLSVPVPQELQP